MIPGAHTIQMLMEGDPYYWGGFLIFFFFMGAVIWSEVKPDNDNTKD